MMSIFPCLAHRPMPPVDVPEGAHEATPALVVPEIEELKEEELTGGAVLSEFGTSFLLISLVVWDAAKEG